MSESGSQPLRVAFIGTGKRCSYMFAPILKALSNDVELVAVWGRSEGSAKKLGTELDVPWYTNMDTLIRETAPQIGIVSVNYQANGEVGLMAVESGLHVLLETPIAHHLHDADAIIQAAEQRGLKIEIAEQFHKRPQEQLKLRLLDSGLFGRVYSSFSDFAGHGYHGVSVMRSYIGFNERPTHVVGAVRNYDLASHWARLTDRYGERTETQEHGIVTYENGQIGIFHWTNVGYDSALRWWRSSRFLAEKGMGIAVGHGIEVDEQLSLVTPDGEAPHFITVERRLERNDGGALIALIAHTGDPNLPVVRWDNPFFVAGSKGKTVQWHDDEIGVASCLMSLVNAVRNGTDPDYGPYQGRLDQEIILALRESSAQGGNPVALPLPRNG